MSLDGKRIRREIVQILRDHDGKPCPSNLKFSELLQIGTRQASEFLGALQLEGTIIKHGRQCSRAFTVLKTGEKTLPQKSQDHAGLPKWSVTEIGKIYRAKAAPLPPHVWYGRYGKNGERIDDYGNPA